MNTREEFMADALAGLSARPRWLPCKYLYDDRGSNLFEDICRTRDYYVTRADLALMEANIGSIAENLGPGVHVIEFGSGEGLKTRMLLENLESPRAYTPIEISSGALEASARALAEAFPDLDILPHQADYTRPVDDSALYLEPPPRRRVVYFPGSTISNFTHDEAEAFLGRMGHIAGRGGRVLIGVDLIKPRERLIRAYDDSEGVTAAFNLNLLERMNRELDAGFDLESWRHEARWNDQQARIEMHLVASRDTGCRLDGKRLSFSAGETIHTESSHKYSIEGFRSLAKRAGLECLETWTDPEGLFSTHLLRISAG